MKPGVIDINPDRARLIQLFCDTPFGGQTSNRSRDDFGGPATCWCHLRRRDKDYNFARDHPPEYHDDAFGRYLGQHGAKWVVAVCKLGGLDRHPDYFHGFVEYDSLGELKHFWELD